jgi:hypothetical protein
VENTLMRLAETQTFLMSFFDRKCNAQEVRIFSFSMSWIPGILAIAVSQFSERVLSTISQIKSIRTETRQIAVISPSETEIIKYIVVMAMSE